MNSIITKDFGVSIAENFENSISNGIDFVYLMMGKASVWPNGDYVEYPYDTTEYKNSVFKNGIILKKITGSDIQPVIPRVDWASGTLYVAYDQTTNLYAKNVTTEILDLTVTIGAGTLNKVQANAGFNLTDEFNVGDIIRIGSTNKEVIYVDANGAFMNVNTTFASAVSEGEIAYRIDVQDPMYYVRNKYDQVFKCLYNNENNNSTSSPEITIGGELPENPYVQTADGYKWKYMYTIPSGLKKKFFTTNYMPVLRDTVVYNNAESGRLDIIQITEGGTGYYNGGTVTDYPVLTISGDGTGANATVDITSGVVVEVNITDGGTNYTNATVTIVDPLQLNTGTDATLRAVISPQYGHGSDPARELGASYSMISADFQGTVEGYLPTPRTAAPYDDFRQIALIRNPLLANGSAAIQSIYPMYTKLYVENITTFAPDTQLMVEDTDFTATALFYDTAEDALYVNNVQGDANTIATLFIQNANNSTNRAQVYTVEKPSINILSGEILYIENRDPVTRDANQTETAKIVIEF